MKFKVGDWVERIDESFFREGIHRITKIRRYDVVLDNKYHREKRSFERIYRLAKLHKFNQWLKKELK